MRSPHYIHAWRTPLDGQVVSLSVALRRLRHGKHTLTGLTDAQVAQLRTAQIFDDHEPARALLAAHESSA